MKAESLSVVKKELQELSAPELAELCVAMAKYRKENKDFLSYLLFRAHDKAAFAEDIRTEIDSYFADINTQANLYFAKKSLRKILRLIGRYSKYLADPALNAELYIYFCKKLKQSGIRFQDSPQLLNLYTQQLKKIHTLLGALHEDLRGDFGEDLAAIALQGG